MSLKVRSLVIVLPKVGVRIAARRPVHEVSFRNRWGAPVGFEVPEPLWSPDGA